MSRIDRGVPHSMGGEPEFSQDQRIWLLERDLDESERELTHFRTEVRGELEAIRRLVTSRLNWIVGIGFSLLVAIVAVLVTVIASTGGQ